MGPSSRNSARHRTAEHPALCESHLSRESVKRKVRLDCLTHLRFPSRITKPESKYWTGLCIFLFTFFLLFENADLQLAHDALDERAERLPLQIRSGAQVTHLSFLRYRSALQPILQRNSVVGTSIFFVENLMPSSHFQGPAFLPEHRRFCLQECALGFCGNMERMNWVTCHVLWPTPQQQRRSDSDTRESSVELGLWFHSVAWRRSSWSHRRCQNPASRTCSLESCSGMDTPPISQMTMSFRTQREMEFIPGLQRCIAKGTSKW